MLLEVGWLNQFTSIRPLASPMTAVVIESFGRGRRVRTNSTVPRIVVRSP